MHREHEHERVRACTYDELEQWREHVRFCLNWHKKDHNRTEIEDCEFLLRIIEEQMTLLARKGNDSG
ncbi:hypothetical protein [Paenibacillus flagellatus]|uniref:Uncharacterized protein n=1 Tax=Paenibacillus flagellatus TaxID=2211139 RepID=A0A2V5KZL1_9BACL|nr:hypothetical protein [Paenibacillus flagellatus]PYI55606.1 hypothetical protein DLM86_07710 [Paenibacillus flagellatus]